MNWLTSSLRLAIRKPNMHTLHALGFTKFQLKMLKITFIIVKSI